MWKKVFTVKFSSLGYCIRQGYKNIWRNRMFSAASILTMAACIFLFSVFFSILTNVNYIIRDLEEEVGITVLFDEGISDEAIEEVGARIRAIPEVTEVTFTSAEEAWEKFKEDYFAENPEYAESFASDNPLANSASYTVHVDQIEKQTAVVAAIQKIEGVRQVNQSAGAAKTLSSFNRLFTYAAITIIGILLLVAIFLISNTVSVGISVRRHEIGIMKLIGATDSFVRAPFIVEGAMLGLIGAAIPLAILYFSYEKLMEALLNHFGILSSVAKVLPPMQVVFMNVLPVGLALGLGIGLFGSIITVRKHLKV